MHGVYQFVPAREMPIQRRLPHSRTPSDRTQLRDGAVLGEHRPRGIQNALDIADRVGARPPLRSRDHCLTLGPVPDSADPVRDLAT